MAELVGEGLKEGQLSSGIFSYVQQAMYFLWGLGIDTESAGLEPIWLMRCCGRL